ncbi:hypothetical protein SAMN04488103_11434 [Gemmobacter aquatilis]|uniref:Uncharacterized protein n=1 Tax=Gemmobacter aquatilis TaxID=933059 RepID=A0A1H8MR59_9RHOB|nr:hypothetical protein [Gemmobacter aquatilis]SEO19713.1 hypothetical protein SAMN04488103_11434 [Gemmobacter aquatilis]
MAKHLKVQIVGGALALIGVFSTAIGAETPAPLDAVQEEAFLDVLPKIDIPEEVQPIPGAVNEEVMNWLVLVPKRGPFATFTVLCVLAMSL